MTEENGTREKAAPLTDEQLVILVNTANEARANSAGWEHVAAEMGLSEDQVRARASSLKQSALRDAGARWPTEPVEITTAEGETKIQNRRVKDGQLEPVGDSFTNAALAQQIAANPHFPFAGRMSSPGGGGTGQPRRDLSNVWEAFS